MFLDLLTILIRLLILTILYCKDCAAQGCNYDVNNFTQITCFEMRSVQQLRDTINTTLDEARSLPRLIEYLKLESYRSYRFNINLLRFLPELKELKVVRSYIRRLSPEKEEADFNETTDITETKGMYRSLVKSIYLLSKVSKTFLL